MSPDYVQGSDFMEEVVCPNCRKVVIRPKGSETICSCGAKVPPTVEEFPGGVVDPTPEFS